MANSRNGILRLLRKDWEYIAGYKLPVVKLRFTSVFEQKYADVYGLWDDQANMITLHETLKDGMLYYIALHEYGHALGLGHSTGVMAAAVAPVGKKLTLANRYRWCASVARKAVWQRHLQWEDGVMACFVTGSSSVLP